MGYFLSSPTQVRSEADLLRALASGDGGAAREATAALWECWHDEAGPAARAEMDHGIDAMAQGDLEEASAVFRRLMAEHPEWPEPINKQATVLYLQGLPEESIALCGETVKLKPDHFGAWGGMALCALQTGDWLLAREAVLQSLRLQPHSRHSQQLLVLVDSRLANC